jgi:Domain of unknown function (DUF4383)
VGHAQRMQSKSLQSTALTDCTVVLDTPMVSDPLAPASPPRRPRRLQGSNHLLPRGRSELRTARPTMAIPIVGLLGLGAYFTGQTVTYARGMAVLFGVPTVLGFFPQPLLGLVPLGGADIPLHAATALLAAAAGWLYRPGTAGRPAAVRQ